MTPLKFFHYETLMCDGGWTDVISMAIHVHFTFDLQAQKSNSRKVGYCEQEIR